MNTVAYVLLALAIGYAVGRYRATSFQNRGEALVSKVLRSNFGAPEYHLLNHVTLRLKDRTTQIDHILVSRYGVFVIETKHYKGWIFANAQHSTWTQVIFKHKLRFQNPIFQNRLHVRAVQELLDFLPPDSIRSIVVFTGDAEFKTEIPAGVIELRHLVEHVRASSNEVMSTNRVQFCVGRLETSRLSITGKTDLDHVQSLERRHGGLH